LPRTTAFSGSWELLLVLVLDFVQVFEHEEEDVDEDDGLVSDIFANLTC